MSHTTEIVKYEKVGNQYAFTIRCCGNASTDFVHTMAPEAFIDPDKRAQSIGEARNRCSNNHELANKAEDAALQELGNPKEHV